MLTALYLLLAQGTLGALDTLWYHEYQQQLPRNATAKVELRLHASRDFAYTLVFGALAWLQCHGAWAWLFMAILAFEIGITLWDFIEEDLSRRLPAGERVMHTVMAIIYGAFLAYLIPELLQWAAQATELVAVQRGWLSWLLTGYAAGVFCSGIRDIVASYRWEPAHSRR